MADLHIDPVLNEIDRIEVFSPDQEFVDGNAASYADVIDILPFIEASSDTAANYYLDSGEFLDLEAKLVTEIKQTLGSDTVAAVWINTNSPYANLVRTLEAREFPEIPEILSIYEECSKFLALIDTRDGTDRIVHAFRLSSRDFIADENMRESESEEKIGIALLDDIIDSGQGVSAKDIVGYYQSIGIDINSCISVETNFRVGDKIKRVEGLPTAQLGYIAVFKAVEANMGGERNAAIFAHLNRPAVVSLKMVGVEYEAILNLDELKTPTSGPKKFDDRYTPVAILPTENNMTTFRNLTPFAAPEVIY